MSNCNGKGGNDRRSRKQRRRAARVEKQQRRERRQAARESARLASRLTPGEWHLATGVGRGNVCALCHGPTGGPDHVGGTIKFAGPWSPVPLGFAEVFQAGLCRGCAGLPPDERGRRLASALGGWLGRNIPPARREEMAASLTGQAGKRTHVVCENCDPADVARVFGGGATS
jgi:hypothetical protein